MNTFDTLDLSNLNSFFDNVIYLDIETSGLDSSLKDIDKSKWAEIIEIGAIKFKSGDISTFHSLIKPEKIVPEAIFDLCEGLTKEDLSNAPLKEDILPGLNDFLEGLPLICHNGKFERNFLTTYYNEVNLRFNNDILDTMELFALLEPHHKEFNLNYFIREKLSESSLNLISEKHRGLIDAKDTLLVLNKVLESNNIGNFFNGYNITLDGWNWLPLLSHYVTYIEIEKNFKGLYQSSNITIDSNEFIKGNLKLTKNCEETLRDVTGWRKLSPNYSFRKAQYDVTKNVRKSLEQKALAIMEAPTGTGKSVGYLLPSIYSALNGERVFISTNTKELQNQLVTKDIPNLLKAFNLNGKLDYKVIKGKSNYLCFDEIDDMLNSSFNYTIKDRLGLVYLHRYAYGGKFGDSEEINYWVIDNFNLKSLISHCNAGNDNCDINACSRLCFYKETVESMEESNLIILNHALLLRWPYKEEVKNVILDEAHNLKDLLFDVYAERLNSLELSKLLDEIISYDGQRGCLAFLWKHLKNKENNTIDKVKKAILLSKNAIDNVALCSRKNMKLQYNLDISFNEDFTNYNEVLTAFKLLIEELLEVYKPIKKLIDYNNLDNEGSKNKNGAILVKKCDKLKGFIDLANTFIQPEDNFKCHGFSATKEGMLWEAYIKDLNPAAYFSERFLKTLDSGVFLSATLKNSGHYQDFKKSLGITNLENKQLIEVTNIENTFNLESRTLICSPTDGISYSDSNFITYLKNSVLQLLNTIPGNILILFTSKRRQDAFKSSILSELNNRHIRLYENKKDVVHLKDRNKKSILIGSKGFFEGIDVAGDGLNCVILEKLPNISPTDPLFKKLIAKQNIAYAYGEVNEPRVITSFKQCFGRLIRTEYDFGYFLVMDGGTNSRLWSKIRMEYPKVPVIHAPINSIVQTMPKNYKKWECLNFDKIIIETQSSLKDEIRKVNFKNYEILTYTLNEFYNKEFKKRNLTNSIELFIQNKSLKGKYKIDGCDAELNNIGVITKTLSDLIKNKR